MPAAATTALALIAASAAPTGATTITLDGATAEALRADGVAVARQAVLPVRRGRVGTNAALALRGKITLRTRSRGRTRRVVLTGWKAQTRGRRITLTAVSGRRRRALLTATAPKRRLRVNRAAGTVRLRPTRVRLTRSGARHLRSRLALKRVPTGVLGTLRISVRLGGATSGAGGGGTPGNPGTGDGGGDPPAPPPACRPGFGSGAVEPAPPPLTRPATAVDVSSATYTWRPRASFIQYVASGEGTTATDGATDGPSETVPGNSARLVYSFGFALRTGSWHDPVSDTAGLFGRGTVRFRYSDHGIDITIKDPEIELAGGRSRAIFTLLGSDCSVVTATRGVMLDLAPGAAGGTPPNHGYGQIPATITRSGADMLSGFYLPGDAWGSFAVAFSAP